MHDCANFALLEGFEDRTKLQKFRSVGITIRFKIIRKFFMTKTMPNLKTSEKSALNKSQKFAQKIL